MAVARETVRLGLSARAAAKVKLRQPLKRGGRRGRRARARGHRAPGRHRARPAQRQAAALRRGRRRARLLRGQAQLPHARAALRQGGCRRWPRRSRRSTRRTSPRRCARVGRSASRSTATTTSWPPTTCCWPWRRSRATSSSARARTRWRSSSRFDDELRREGLAREVVHAVQNARKAAGLAVEDRIRLVLGGDDELVGAAQAHEEYLVREVLAVEIAYDGVGRRSRRPPSRIASCASAWRARSARAARASSRLCAAAVPIHARAGRIAARARVPSSHDHDDEGGRHGPRQAAHGGGGDPGRALDELRRRVRGGGRLRRRGARPSTSA